MIAGKKDHHLSHRRPQNWAACLSATPLMLRPDRSVRGRRSLGLVFTLFESIKTQELSKNIRRERINENARERVESMARAMAGASERDEDWKDFVAQARALDAALHARRMYET
jgi:hypothetical protein